jgi:hypothetical protein
MNAGQRGRLANVGEPLPVSPEPGRGLNALS